MADLATPATPDFVNVQLTEKAVAIAKDGPLRFSNGRREFSFFAGKPQKVELRYEWKALLSQRVLQDGSPIFELVPAATPAAATTVSATSVSATDATAAAKS